jgi:beta-glucosidase/6-phospho-beta-glucosidase/beta-galactosidase
VNNDTNPLYPTCADTGYTYENGWLIGPAADPLSPWLHKATDWVPEFMRYIKKTWADPAGNLSMAITEMGFDEPFEGQQTILQNILTDPIRTSVFKDYMEAILICLSEGIQLVGVLAWSFVDNFEVSLDIFINAGDCC